MKEDLKNLKFEVLKAEVNIAFREIIERLEEGKRLILIAEDLLAGELNSERLREMGALVKVCGLYGATVIFSQEPAFVVYDRLLQTEKNSSKQA